MGTKNYLKAVRFEKPDYIPVNFVINDACWHHYPKELLWELMESHPLLFPEFKRPSPEWMPPLSAVAIKDKPYTDSMGCTWHTSDDGITGTVYGHPLEDWSRFGTEWHIPDPENTDGLYPVDWKAQEKLWKEIKASGEEISANLRHGHTFLQLCDLRGYENLLFDMMDEEPLLDSLIDQLTEFNLAIINRFVRNGASLICYPEDLGMQVGPMLSPTQFKRYIKPAYRKIMKPAREAGIAIQMHSDGDIRLLADDLIDSGVQSINLQDLVNGIDWIADRYRGRVCVDLDIDRQQITPYGTPEQIDALIKEEVTKLATPQGGLALTYGLYPGIPHQNIKALMDALEKYMLMFS